MIEFDPRLYRDEVLEKQSQRVLCFPFSQLVRMGRFYCNDFQIRFHHLLESNHQ